MLDEAFTLFKAAAEGGDVSAFNNLGFFYDEGIGTPVDKDLARRWYRKAAAAGDFAGAANLAQFYLQHGNLRQARRWLTKLVARGDGDAALELARLRLIHPTSTARTAAAALLRQTLRLKSTTPASREEAKILLDQLNAYRHA